MGSNVWADAEVAMDRVNELFTDEEMRDISNMPSHKMVSHHVHKLVQVIFLISSFCFVHECLAASTNFGHDETFCCQVLGETMHITSQYLASEEKAVVATLKVEALEAEASGLQKDLIIAIDANNTSKEQIKALTEQLDSEKLLIKQKDDLFASAGQRMKATVAKAIHAFQATKEYNTIMFQWYFEGFELLRRYLIKHGPGLDLEELDFEVVDKKIKANEAAQVTQATTSTSTIPSEADKDNDNTSQA